MCMFIDSDSILRIMKNWKHERCAAICTCCSQTKKQLPRFFVWRRRLTTKTRLCRLQPFFLFFRKKSRFWKISKMGCFCIDWIFRSHNLPSFSQTLNKTKRMLDCRHFCPMWLQFLFCLLIVCYVNFLFSKTTFSTWVAVHLLIWK